VKKSAEFGGGKIHIIVNNAGFTWDGVIHKVRPSFFWVVPVAARLLIRLTRSPINNGIP
jgi:hypothetical protein